MKFLHAALKLINKPFPETESTFGIYKIIAAISLFVTFFLFIFQPFGISTLESNMFIICLGFGAMTFIASVIFEFLVGTVLKLKGELAQWTFGKWMLYNIGVMLTISLANFLFARVLFFGFIQWNLLPAMMYSTFMIGIIPITVIGGLSILMQEKKYQNMAKNINLQKAMVTHIEKPDEHFVFNIPVSQIKYIEALQNYVSIGYIDANGQFMKNIERATLKNILEEITGSALIKSHRSFLVNRKAIISVSGNAQGLILQLSDCEKTIPVSRSYVSFFRD